MAFTFDDPEPMRDRCANLMMDDGCPAFGGGDYGMTTAIDGVSPLFGRARHIENDQCMILPVSMDYSGDFTIQFWMKIEDEDPGAAQDWPWEAIWSDIECNAPGGLVIGMNGGGRLGVDFCRPGDNCTDPCGFIANYPHPTDEAWHFYRLSRDTTANTIKLCQDGELKGMSALPGTMDLSSGELPTIATQFDQTPYMKGAIDDLRFYKRALPCPTF
jgi:hypothetical protein